jgi:peptide/nickel transport system permease protein
MRWALNKHFTRVVKYIATRGTIMSLSVVIGIYITILVVNLGGKIDEIYRGMIFESVGSQLLGGWLQDVEPDERSKMIEDAIKEREDAMGLNKPFFLRSLYILRYSLTLDFGGSVVKNAILTAIPYTVFLVGTSNLIVFVTSVFLALSLSYNPDSLSNKIFSVLSPLTFAPGWVYGIILITLFSGWLLILPWPRTTAILESRIAYRPTSFHLTSQTVTMMILPAISIFLSALFQGAYIWRSFFFAFSHEDYVELAKAKGLSDARIQRMYVLRPILPYVITNFTIQAISIWQEAIPLELLFGWPGVGLLFILSLQQFNTPIVLGIVIISAYLLGLTVLFLDILYAMLDPRLKVGGGGEEALSISTGKFNLVAWFLHQLRKKPIVNPSKRLFAGAETWQKQKRAKTLNPGEMIRFARSHARNLISNVRTMIHSLRILLRNPGGALGLFGVVLLMLIAGYTVLAVPIEKAVQYWRGQGEDIYFNYWYQNPVNASPAWTNLFRKDKLPSTLILDSKYPEIDKETNQISDEMVEINIPLSFNYQYDGYPSEITLFFESQYLQKPPLVILTWHTPSGREIDLGSIILKPRLNYYLSTDESLQRKLAGQQPIKAIFSSFNGNTIEKGVYTLKVKAFVFEPQSTLDVQAVLYGQVHGLAGTDPFRRDPIMAILWGTVFTLAFGVVGAFGTSLISVIFAAASAWFSGWVDKIIQFMTEVNLVLPRIAVALLVFLLFSKSIWVVLGVLVLFNIFGGTIKSYRAVFLQIRSAPYVEAAQASGASNIRIIWRYMLPRVMPTLIPSIMISVPNYVFYESTLAFLGVSDPYLPTWGKIIYDALARDALLKGYWHQVIVPIGLLMATGVIFTSLGRALERYFNPSGESNG